MYFIYHIKGIKIGVSTNPEQRVKNQGYTEYEILEEHTCIDTVSTRELELQKEYGYRVDQTTYKQSYEWCQSGCSKGGKAMAKKNKEKFRKISSKYAKENSLKSRWKLQKKVYQYDFSGNLVNTFEGVNEAKRQLGYCISANLRKKQKTCHGFIFSYQPIIQM